MRYWSISVLLLLLWVRGIAQVVQPFWLHPQQQTESLQQAIELYTCIAENNEWLPLPRDLLLSPGDTNLAVNKLQHNLRLTHDLQADYLPQEGIYDSLLVQATINFQSRMGLTPDGVVGSQTVAAINIPPASRVKLLQDNLQRWKVLSEKLPVQTLLINIPAFKLYVLDSTGVPLQMKVITGTKKTPTYQNQTELLTIVVNPVWGIPRSIAVNEIVPLLRKNPGYLASRKMRLYLNGKQVNPWRVNWHKVNAANYNYHLVQMPHPKNELGEIKFLYKSKANQYMHDTPKRQFFNYFPRDFSHGCIRLEKPYELAVYILQQQPGYTSDKAKERLAESTGNLHLGLKYKMPLFIVYQTCWVDEKGLIQFRKDVYSYEKEKT